MSVSGCRDVKGVLFQFLDNNLDNRIAASVESHLATCKSCRKELERSKAVLSLLASAKAAPPNDFTVRVMARIAAECSSSEGIAAKKTTKAPIRRVFARRFGTFAAAAALVAVMAVGWRVLPAFMKKTSADQADYYAAEISEGSNGTMSGGTEAVSENEQGEGDNALSASETGGLEMPIMYGSGFICNDDFEVDKSQNEESLDEEEISGLKMHSMPDATTNNELDIDQNDNAESIIERYAPDFLGRAAAAVIVYTANPILKRPEATDFITGEGFSAYFIEGSGSKIAEAIKLAAELGGDIYGEPKSSLVWVEISD